MSTPVSYRGKIQLGVWKYLTDVNLPPVFGCVSNQGGSVTLNGGFVDQSGAVVACAITPPNNPFETLIPSPASTTQSIGVVVRSGVATIDWGDGTVEMTAGGTYTFPSVSDPVSHTYAAGLTNVIVKVSGDIDILQLNSPDFTEVTNYGTSLNCTHYLLNSTGLVSVPATFPSSVTNTSYMFGGCTSFNQLVTIPSSVTDTSGMFGGCTSFNQLVTIPSSVTDTSYMFSGCTSFNQLVTLTTPNLLSADNMLNGCTIFDQDLSHWCVTNITSEPDGFATGSALTSPHMPVWGTCSA